MEVVVIGFVIECDQVVVGWFCELGDLGVSSIDLDTDLVRFGDCSGFFVHCGAFDCVRTVVVERDGCERDGVVEYVFVFGIDICVTRSGKCGF